jgi:hypothetical protein
VAVSKLLIVRFNTDWFHPKNEIIFLKLTIPLYVMFTRMASATSLGRHASLRRKPF